jgi:hypothetical protein
VSWHRAKLVALLLAARTAVACPCSDEGSSGGSVVREDERYAVALAASGRSALGRFDNWGEYHRLAPGEGEQGEELLLRAGLRWPQRWEWLGELGYANYRLRAPRYFERESGVGDALVRLRYSALSEAMPHAAFPAPGVIVSGLLRAPLGAVAGDASANFGSGGAPRGLGAWEVGAGLELKRSLVPVLELWLGGEAAYRFEDHSLGRARRLGPRAEVALGMRALLAPWLSSTLALRVRAIGDVELAGRSLPGTSERLLSVIAGLAVYDRPSRVRSALTLGLDPPAGSQGATAGVAVGVLLARGFR